MKSPATRTWRRAELANPVDSGKSALVGRSPKLARRIHEAFLPRRVCRCWTCLDWKTDENIEAIHAKPERLTARDMSST
jgi:hypothetical protein